MYRILWIIGLVLAFSSCTKRTVDFITQAPQDITAPARFEFENTSENCEEYVWDLGDGTMSIDSVPSNTYFLSGTYDIVLKGKAGKKFKEARKTITVKAPEKCLVYIETSQGNMMVELFDNTPLHRDNFIKLAEQGFYDGLLFHRVMQRFMIQGGDPKSKGAPIGVQLGSGGPGYQVDAEFNGALAHVKGALAAARTPDNANPKKRSSGSQFYIVHGKTVSERELKQMESRHGNPYPEHIIESYLKDGGYPPLDQEYTIFGQVIEGLDVIDKIAAVKTDRANRPVEDISMKVRVIK
ncbi:MAG: cyclophilin family peptidyl-prolyl cis-trans isomerase [Saprospiraceae bacterium]|jgi:cyclophilin family peptidyl-prolyl cis-trans isomerase